MKKAVLILAIFAVFSAIFAQGEFRQRAMTQSTVHFSRADGSVSTADFWQLKLGRFEVNLTRRFPGEGDVAITGNVNMMFMSGGYLEGNGAGSRGIIRDVTAEFAVKRDGRFMTVRQDAIEYIFANGNGVKLIDTQEEEDLYIIIESERNVFHPRDFSLSVFGRTPNPGELAHQRDIDDITSIAFTAERARKGHQATLADAALQR